MRVSAPVLLGSIAAANRYGRWHTVLRHSDLARPTRASSSSCPAVSFDGKSTRMHHLRLDGNGQFFLFKGILMKSRRKGDLSAIPIVVRGAGGYPSQSNRFPSQPQWARCRTARQPSKRHLTNNQVVLPAKAPNSTAALCGIPIRSCVVEENAVQAPLWRIR
jgi:hypothetical protein